MYLPDLTLNTPRKEVYFGIAITSTCVVFHPIFIFLYFALVSLVY